MYLASGIPLNNETASSWTFLTNHSHVLLAIWQQRDLRVRDIASLVGITAECVVADERPRLFVLSDIGGDPDDQQSLIRLMMYCNEFE